MKHLGVQAPSRRTSVSPHPWDAGARRSSFVVHSAGANTPSVVSARHAKTSTSRATMAKPPKPSHVHAILESLDWTGHVELPTNDLAWLALQISAALDDKRGICGSCGRMSEVIVPTRLGHICEDCIDEASEMAESMREGMEGH